MNRYRQIIESITGLAIIATDRDGILTDWNTGAEHILGWTAAEMLGRSGDIIFTPEDRENGQLQTEMGTALAGGHRIDEGWYMRADGTRFWALGETMPLRDDGGGHVGFVKTLRDRTEQHLSGIRLDELADQLRQAQEAGGVGLFTIDVPTGMISATPEFSRLYGLDHRDIRPAAEFEARVLPEDRTLASSNSTRLSGAAPRDAVYRIRKADNGELRQIERRGEFLYAEDGRPVRFNGIARDVTDEVAAEDALRESEDRYRALFEAVDDGFCIIEFIDGPHGPLSDYVHVEANPGYERHTGITDIVGMKVRDLAPTEADGWVELYGGVLATGTPIRFERDFVTVGRTIEVSAARIEPAARRQVSVLFRDITGRRRAEARLRESEERLRLAVEVGDVGVFDLNLDTEELILDDRVRAAFGVGEDRPVTHAEKKAAVHPEDRPAYDAAYADVMAGGRFDLQFRVIGIDDGAERVVAVRGQVAESRSGERNLVGAVRDVTSAVEADHQRLLLAGELAHRLKNNLALVSSIVAQTLRNAPDVASARQVLSERIQALAKAHDVLMTGHRDAATIADIVRSASAIHDEGGRVESDGPALTLGPKASLALSLIVHELSTNAVKYGALSVPEGRIHVGWQRRFDPLAAGSELVFEWRESGGPPVAPPTRRSFGTRLIEMGLTGASAGSCELVYAPDGLVCRLTAPLADLRS
ncbi:PAS domain-containing sensor histidine kinase [Aureimonas psammosilenae]|uniref:PAS domain-containing sensor histidine kinase n=1 Tax=Aureimonas psammosilenae TaxID=2495496 RepID=UPI00186A7AE8|nr:PAS domain S-box protein [Aureimonas psammosilenae]